MINMHVCVFSVRQCLMYVLACIFLMIACGICILCTCMPMDLYISVYILCKITLCVHLSCLGVGARIHLLLQILQVGMCALLPPPNKHADRYI